MATEIRDFRGRNDDGTEVTATATLQYRKVGDADWQTIQ